MEKSASPLIHCEVPIFYASTDGQTRRIAWRLSEMLRARGIDTLALDVASSAARFVDWSSVRGVVVGASMRLEHYPRGISHFAAVHADDLNRRPSAFFSVSLSAASTKPRDVESARRIAQQFPRHAGWQPAAVASFAGTLAYTHYGLLKRWMMRRIARAEGVSTDTEHDHELTDWTAVEALAQQVTRLVAETSRPAAA